MRSAFAIASLAAAVYASAELPIQADRWPEIESAVATYAGDLQWKLIPRETDDNVQTAAIRFTGGADGNPIADQYTKGQVLLMHSATQDCLNWLTDTADDTQASIPQLLFEAGYDVWLGCRRGTFASRRRIIDEPIAPEDEEDFFNYDTETVGRLDFTSWVTKMLQVAKVERNDGSCGKVQVLTNGLGISEALAGMAAYPNDSEARIANVVSLAPCAIPTYFARDEEHRRLLSAVEDLAGEIPRELADLMENEVNGRQLSHGPSSYYWNVQLKHYCMYHPDVCMDYCDFYPDYCEEFCSYEHFEQFCVPKAISGYYKVQEVLKRNDIYSLYGPNWSDQVDAICEDVGEWTNLCSSYQDTVDAGLKEMSCKQLEHMFQMSYNQAYNQFSDTFEEDQEGTPIAGVDSVNVPLRTWYVDGDQVCDTDVNQGLLNTVPGQDWYSTFYDDEITRMLYAQNDNATVLAAIFASLETAPADLDSCVNLGVWTD